MQDTDNLREAIESGHAILVIGSGISIAATDGDPLATWPGLLRSAIDACLQRTGVHFAAVWESETRNLVEQGTAASLVSAATRVSAVLDPSSGTWRAWLAETIGSLTVQNSGPIEALLRLNLPLMTTNYDHLLETVSGKEPVSWRDLGKVFEFVHGSRDAVFHIHGHFDDPKSVVFGSDSYAGVLSVPEIQHILQALATTHVLIFVGVGVDGGLADPNFSALLGWMNQFLRESPQEHFLLVRSKDVELARNTLPRDARIRPIAFGSEHAELPGFLLGLPQAPAPPPRRFVRQAAAVAAPNPSVCYLRWSTFALGGTWGVVFLIFYLIEFGFLLLNQVDVMGPSGTRYLLYTALAQDARTTATKELAYDTTCWLTDTKKFFSYSILWFWLALFSRVMFRRSSEHLGWHASPWQEFLFGEMTRDRRVLPFLCNAVLAFVLTCFFSPAALAWWQFDEPGNTSVYHWFSREMPAFGDIGFLFYRLVNPILVYLCMLHLVIAGQVLLGIGVRGKRDPTVARFAVVGLVSVIGIILADRLAAFSILDKIGKSFVHGLGTQYAVGYLIIAFFLALIAIHRTTITSIRVPSRFLPQASRSAILPLAIIPILWILVPTIAFAWFVAPRLAAIAAPSCSASDLSCNGYKKWLNDGRLTEYLDDLKEYVVERARVEERFRTRTHLICDEKLRERVREADPVSKYEPFEVVREVVRMNPVVSDCCSATGITVQDSLRGL